MLEFGRTAFAGHVRHIDLELRRDAHAAFADDISPAEVLRRLQTILGTEVVPGPTSTDDVIHEVLLQHLHDYFFVGGMPAVVRSFVDSGATIDIVTASLLSLYQGALAEQFVGQELRAALKV